MPILPRSSYSQLYFLLSPAIDLLRRFLQLFGKRQHPDLYGCQSRMEAKHRTHIPSFPHPGPLHHMRCTGKRAPYGPHPGKARSHTGCSGSFSHHRNRKDPAWKPPGAVSGRNPSCRRSPTAHPSQRGRGIPHPS